MITSIVGKPNENRYDRTATGSACIYRAFGGDIVYLVKSLKAKDLWVLPKGGLEDGLTAEQNAVKEMQEEGGQIIEIVSPAIFDEVLHYDGFQGMGAKRQREIYFLSRWLKVTAPGEWEEEGLRHTAWFPIDDLDHINMTDIQREVVRRAHDYFKATLQFPVSTSHRA